MEYEYLKNECEEIVDKKRIFNFLFLSFMIVCFLLPVNILARISDTSAIDGNTSRRVFPPKQYDDNAFELAKFKRIELLFTLLRDKDNPHFDEMYFFRELGDGDIKISIKDLVAFKADIINSKAAEKKNYDSGIDHWNKNYRHLEQNLMEKRREVVLETWDKTASEYMKTHPDCTYIARMDVGGWVRETKEKMRFEGDIDFSVVMLQSNDAIEIRNLFEGNVKQVFNMDMVAIDALATAHRSATLSVYIGDYGADWAEIDAIRRGQMHIIERNSDGTLHYVDATPVQKSVIFTILKNNIAMSRGEPDRLAEIRSEKLIPEPMHDMEPGISLEFLRHITNDAFNSKLALHEKVLKMSKYLNRSVQEHNKILRSAGMASSPIDIELGKYAEGIIKSKENKYLTPEKILIIVMNLTENFLKSL